MRLPRFLFHTIRGIYTILATYLLAWILFFAALSLVFYFALGGPRVTAALEQFALRLHLPPAALRLFVFALLHAAFIIPLRRRLIALQGFLERAFDAATAPIKRAFTGRPRLRRTTEVLFTLVVTAALIPFLLQPTLVAGFDRYSWLERTANLLDGTATIGAADSIVGFYRRFTAEPEAIYPLTPDDEALGGEPPKTPGSAGGTGGELQSLGDRQNPMMDRWDPLILDAAKNDPYRAAQIKAFMWVESAGRQFAVSPTGCSGLMQFCAPTARDRRFRDIFGTGQIYVCRCRHRRCRIDSSTQSRLESGDLSPAEDPSLFPCEITDARFDAKKSIFAGAAYIDRLHNAYGGNIYLMYIGYNSGPAVADALWRRLGQDPATDLDQIALILSEAMRPYYGAGSPARARSLVNTHLPKLKQAFNRYYNSPAPTTPPPPNHPAPPP